MTKSFSLSAAKKVAFCGLLAALAIVLTMFENMLPEIPLLPAGVPFGAFQYCNHVLRRNNRIAGGCLHCLFKKRLCFFDPRHYRRADESFRWHFQHTDYVALPEIRTFRHDRCGYLRRTGAQCRAALYGCFAYFTRSFQLYAFFDFVFHTGRCRYRNCIAFCSSRAESHGSPVKFTL